MEPRSQDSLKYGRGASPNARQDDASSPNSHASEPRADFPSSTNASDIGDELNNVNHSNKIKDAKADYACSGDVQTSQKKGSAKPSLRDWLLADESECCAASDVTVSVASASGDVTASGDVIGSMASASGDEEAVCCCAE